MNSQPPVAGPLGAPPADAAGDVPCSRRRLALLLYGALAAAVVGVSLLATDLQDELARLELWRRAIFLVGDATALFWFLWFTVRHGVRGLPLRTVPVSGPLASQWYVVGSTLLLGLGLDFACTVFLKEQEERPTSRPRSRRPRRSTANSSASPCSTITCSPVASSPRPVRRSTRP